MSLHPILARDVAPQPWRNGGGQTRELLVWPATPSGPADSWRLRISLADITQDGPFSAFAGVTRCFTVVSGAGVALGFADRRLELRPGDPPLTFDGAAAPSCHLLGGPTQDLNLMVRGGIGRMEAIAAGVENTCGSGMASPCGLYVPVPGRLRTSSGQVLQLPAHALLWDDQPTAGTRWLFTPDNETAHPMGWWLAFTPDDGTT